MLIYIWQKGLSILSTYIDFSYHLSTAQGFLRAGGVTTWDFWESLPIGRPHNYPPLFHIILASFLQLGANPTIAVKLVMELVMVGGMAIYTFGLARIFNIKIAFFSLVLLASAFTFFQLSLIVMPSTIVIFLVPFLFYCMLSRRWISYSVILILMLYLHLFLPYLILISLLMYLLIFERVLTKKFLFSTAVSFIFYSPWLIHVLVGGWSYIRYFNNRSNADIWREFILINLVVVILAVIGVVLIIRNRRKISNHYFFFLICSFVILSPSFLLAGRMIDGHLLPFAAIPASYAILNIYKDRVRYIILPILIFYCLYNPTLRVGEKTGLVLIASPLNKFSNQNFNRRNDPAIKYHFLLEAIEGYSIQGETITSALTSFDGNAVDKNYQLSISNLLGSYSGRSTLNLRQPEFYKRSLPDLTKTKLLLLNKSSNELTPEYFSNLKYDNSEYINENINKNFQEVFSMPSDNGKRAYLYVNKSTNVIKESIPPHKFSLWLADGIIVILIGILVVDFNKKGLVVV